MIGAVLRDASCLGAMGLVGGNETGTVAGTGSAFLTPVRSTDSAFVSTRSGCSAFFSSA
jgi:hypothetical protein